MDILIHSLNFAAKQVLSHQRYDRIRTKTNVLRKSNELKQAPKVAKRSGQTPKKTFISGLESYVRRVAEQTFGVPFKSTRNLPWLKSPMTGKPLELDCYNEDLKCAIETQGSQHRRFNSFFHKSQTDYEDQLKRDHVKRVLCATNGVVLLEVPHWIKKQELQAHLLAAYEEGKSKLKSS